MIETLSGIVDSIGKIAIEVTDKAKSVVSKSQSTIISAIDENVDGEIGIEDIIIKSLKVPDIRINRSEFLKKELFKNHPPEIIDDAIANTLAHTGIPLEEVNKIADEAIKFERNCVSWCNIWCSRSEQCLESNI